MNWTGPDSSDWIRLDQIGSDWTSQSDWNWIGLDQGPQTGATHPDGDQRGCVEGREQHGVTKHQDEAGGQGDLQGAPEKRETSRVIVSTPLCAEL